jgi:adenylate cyclase class 2
MPSTPLTRTGFSLRPLRLGRSDEHRHPALSVFAKGGRRLCFQPAEGPLVLSSLPSVLNLLTYSRKHNDTIPMPKSKKIKPEIEIKLRITYIPTILRKIESLGAKTQGQVFEQNTLYDTPQSDLRRRDMLLRLRAETPAIQNARSTRGERVILTSKAPLRTPRASKRPPRYKERAEREQVAANTARQCAAALTALGFRPAFRYDKFRTTFRLPHLQLDLDETPAGTFLELEGQPQAINRAAHALGFTNQAYLRATYWDLHVADCRRRGAIPKNMLFPQK